jgi:hypothetical protein
LRLLSGFGQFSWSVRTLVRTSSIPYCVGGLVGGAGGSRIRPITLVLVFRTRFDVPWFYKNAKPFLSAASSASAEYAMPLRTRALSKREKILGVRYVCICFGTTAPGSRQF